MPILFRLLPNLLFGVWRKLNKQSVGTRETPTLSQTDLKQTRLPGFRRSKYTISARSRRLNWTGEEAAAEERGGLRCVSEGEPPHESAMVYLGRQRVNRYGGCTSDFIAKVKKCSLFFTHDGAEER